MRRVLWETGILILCLICPVSVRAWPAALLNIYDGDTITVAPAGDESTPVFVCLYGIDAPDLKQKGGQAARAWLAEQLKVRSLLEIIPMSYDSYGRVHALVARNGQVLNGQLVTKGHAWVTRSCQAMVCRTWMKAQHEAREAKKGLWATDDAPWEWKKKESQTETLPMLPGGQTTPDAK